MDKQLLTATEAAKAIGVTRTMIYYYIRKGLPVYRQDKLHRIFGNNVVYHNISHVKKDELLQFVAQCKK